jgi:hypothetical protein
LGNAPLEASDGGDGRVGDEAGFLVIDDTALPNEGSSLGWHRTTISLVARKDCQLSFRLARVSAFGGSPEVDEIDEGLPLRQDPSLAR